MEPEIDVPRTESLAMWDEATKVVIFTGPTLDECVAVARNFRFSDEFVGAMFRRFLSGRLSEPGGDDPRERTCESGLPVSQSSQPGSLSDAEEA